MSHRSNILRRCGGSARAGVAALLLGTLLPGCITGNEAREAMAPDPHRQLDDLETDHEIGIVNDAEYEARRRELLAEE